MRATKYLLIALAIGFTIAGCSSDKGGETTTGTAANTAGGTEGNKTKLKIAVIPKGALHEFWKSIHAGADDAAKELGVEIIFKGPLTEGDRDSQIKTVEDFTTQGVSGIVLAPLDNKALAIPVEDAAKQDIPVVIIDSGLDSDKYVSFVATDNEKGGHMAGAELGRLLNGKGSVIMLRYEVGSASTDLREKGFHDEITKNFPNIKIVSDNQYAHTTVETAQKTSENLLSTLKKPDGSLSIDGIYCPNESSTFGMLRVLEDNKWAGKVKFVGFDASDKLVEGLRAGEINGLIVQNPRKMGYLGVKTLVDAINKKPVEKRIDTGATLVTKENMDQPEVSKLLGPPK